MSVRSGEPTGQELQRLRDELAQREREAAEKERQLERYAADLRETFKQERARALELQRSYMLTVRALSNAVEFRDAYTGRHAERVAAYGLLLAEAAKLRLADSPEVEFGFLLHDVGKVAIPDSILHKPGPLSAEERAVIATHPELGAQIVCEIDFLRDAVDVIRHHHERWDGGGYPAGLAGEAIPVAARVFSVVDVLDALTTERPYRRASSFVEAREMILAEAGTQFDPEVAAVFAAMDLGEFAAIQEQLS